MDTNENIGGFVFVLCGSKEHLDTLALSHSILFKKTQQPIYVVTDNSRNEYPINYPNLIDVKAPAEMDHHQASIWLKTSLHKLLPSNKIFAYLDTDILAYGKSTDNIFNEYVQPVRFAPDHCKMPQFSPYAVNCGCLDTFEKKRKEVAEILKKYDPLSASTDAHIVKKRDGLFKAFHQVKSGGKLTMKFYLKYFTSWPNFKLNEEFHLDHRKKIWFDRENQPVMHKINMRMVARKAGLKWNYILNEITLPDGRSLYSNYCHHLSESIRKKWNININDGNWQHWNGGVFLFKSGDNSFMENWHQLTIEIFKDPQWKTRDQGTLIATVWKLGLQNSAPLSNKWNLILDYYYPNLQVKENGEITIDGKEFIQPELVHIYHHWGNVNWEIWNKVIAKV